MPFCLLPYFTYISPDTRTSWTPRGACVDAYSLAAKTVLLQLAFTLILHCPKIIQTEITKFNWIRLFPEKRNLIEINASANAPSGLKTFLIRIIKSAV